MNISVGVARALAGSGAPSEKQAKKLMRAAIYLQSQHQQRLGKAAPAVKRRGKVRYIKGPPVTGRYPFKRTGNLQASIGIEGLSVASVIATGKLRVGIRSNGFYGAVLEVKYGALGLKDTLADLLPQLSALAGVPLNFQLVDTLLPAGGP